MAISLRHPTRKLEGESVFLECLSYGSITGKHGGGQ